MRYAICKLDGGLVLAAFNLVQPTTFSYPSEIYELREDPLDASEYGGYWDGEVFQPNPSPGATQDPTIDAKILYKIHDDLVSFIQTAFTASENLPQPASNAPPAVASSSAKGSVDARFALEDHAHAINATQQSQISALQSNVSSLLTLTGGLNTPAPADAAPAALAVTAALGTSADYAREDHQHPLPAVAAGTPSRALNSAGFQPSATKATLVSYSVRIICTANLSGSQDGKIELMSDANSTPTTVRATAQNRNSVSLAIALTAVNEQTVCLTYLVPAGHYVRLNSTQTTGAPTFALISQTEIIIG